MSIELQIGDTMATRNIIIYVRITDTESYLVDSNNNILVENKYPIIYYSETPTIKYRPLQSDGTPYLLADFSGYTAFEFGIDNDWDISTVPPVKHATGDTVFTVAEVVVGTTTYVEISFPVDAYTTAFLSDIGVAKELRKGIYAELCAFNAAETEPSLIIQHPFVMRNKLVDIGGAGPSAPVSNYYTKVQSDNLYLTITNPTFTGSITVGAAVLTEAELEAIDGITAGTALASKALILDALKDISGINDMSIAGLTSSDLTASTVLVANASKKVISSVVTSTELALLSGATFSAVELNYITGVTSAIQTQMNLKAPIASPTFTTSITIGAASIIESELETIDGVVPGTQAALKTVVADANINIGVVKATSLYIGTSGAEVQITATPAELNYSVGVTSAIQTQLDSKLLHTDGTITDLLKLNLKDSTTLTIATGVVTATQSSHLIEGEGLADDSLVTISGGTQEDILFIRPANSARNITISHGTGNIVTGDGNDLLIQDNAVIILQYDGTNWRVIGGGGSGGMNWNNVITGATDGVNGNGYLIDSSAGIVTLTLPITPTAGQTVGFTDYTGSASTNNITIARNGSNIYGLAQDITIDTNYTGGHLTYTGATEGWVVTTEISSGTGIGDMSGNVVAPATNTDSYVPQWDGADSKTLKDGFPILDEDAMGSDSAVSLATQQSIKAYVDSVPVVFQLAVSDETTALTTGTAKLTFRMPYAVTLTAVRASVTTAPTDAVITVDINESGSTILSTKLTIDATEKTSTTALTPAVISDTALADDAEITIDIDTVGSTIAGAGLKITLIGVKV